MRDADVLLVIGERLAEITTSGYTLLEVPTPRQALIHVNADPDELGRVYRPTLAINAAADVFAVALSRLPALDGSRWRAELEQGRAEYLGNLEHRRLPGAVDMGDVMAHLRKRLPADAVLASGAGNFTVWAHRFYEFRRFRTQLAPTSGAMGYGVPAAVAAKIAPSRARRRRARGRRGLPHDRAGARDRGPVRRSPSSRSSSTTACTGRSACIRSGTIPGRVSGTDLVNPDFAALARAFGAYGATVERTDEFPAAFEEALASGRPALLELLVDPEALTPRQTLSEIREAALRR